MFTKKKRVIEKRKWKKRNSIKNQYFLHSLIYLDIWLHFVRKRNSIKWFHICCCHRFFPLSFCALHTEHEFKQNERIIWECAKNSVDVTAIFSQRIPLQCRAKFSAVRVTQIRKFMVTKHTMEMKYQTKQIQVQKKNGNGFKNERNLIFFAVCVCSYNRQNGDHLTVSLQSLNLFFFRAVRLLFLLPSADEVAKKKNTWKS